MNQRGFTYIELLIVLGVLLLFSAFFVTVVNPIQRFQEARDDTRETHLNTILLGIEQKLSSEGDWNCVGLPTDKFTEIGTGPGMYDLYSCLTPNYLSKYLVDPKEGSISGRNITDGLVGHWKFDAGSGTTAYDSSGNNNHGLLVSSPTWIEGKKGGALDFDGVDDYVDVNNGSSFNFDKTNPFTLVAWIKTLDNSISQSIMAKQTSSYVGYNFWINSTGKIWFIIGANPLFEIISGPTLITENDWHHVVATYDGSESINGMKLYYNGGLESVEVLESNNFQASIQNDTNLTIARRGAGENFNGSIDDVRIYDRALSAEEIQDLYNYEYSSKYAIWQNPVTKNISLKSIEDETKEVSTGAPEVALNFDGTNDYVDAGNDASLNITDAITVSAWAKPIDPNVNQKIVSSYLGNHRFVLGIVHSHIYIDLWTTGGITNYASAIYGDITSNWNHIVFSYLPSDGHYKMYVNGDDVGHKTTDGNPLQPLTGDVLVGVLISANYFFNGQISDVRIYNRALSAEEVEQLYKGYDIRNGLVGHWPLNEGQGETAYDRSGNNNHGTFLPAGDGPTWTTK